MDTEPTLKDIFKDQRKASPGPTVAPNSQDWAELSGAVAFHLIERHADNWADAELMMDEFAAARARAAAAGAWTAVKDALPAEGTEVTVRLFGGQIRQVVRDAMFCGGWKQVNCASWECVSLRKDEVTHWHPAIVARPDTSGPRDAPWMTTAAAS